MGVSTHKGIYDLQRIHLHWGRYATEGSEHQLNGIKHAAEIQFIHLERNLTYGSTDQDAYTIVAVLADSVPGTSVPNSVWSDLSVPTGYTTSNPISGSNPYASLLLPNRNSYYYTMRDLSQLHFALRMSSGLC